jgi:hypothetical protein
MQKEETEIDYSFIPQHLKHLKPKIRSKNTDEIEVEEKKKKKKVKLVNKKSRVTTPLLKNKKEAEKYESNYSEKKDEKSKKRKHVELDMDIEEIDFKKNKKVKMFHVSEEEKEFTKENNVLKIKKRKEHDKYMLNLIKNKKNKKDDR